MGRLGEVGDSGDISSYKGRDVSGMHYCKLEDVGVYERQVELSHH